MSLFPRSESPSREVPFHAGAPGAGGRAQLVRVLKLLMLVQSERFPNARVLAERCEVSRRTIYRDFEMLAEAGILVRFRPERQGYQLTRTLPLPAAGLDESETRALLILARNWREGEGLGLVPAAISGALKLVQGLPSEARERVMSTAGPFTPLPAWASPSAERRALYETLLNGLATLRQVRLNYRDPRTLTPLTTKFGPYRLWLHDRHWYTVGRSTLHRRIQVIGLPWVDRIVPTDDPYSIPPRFDLERFLGWAWGVEREPVRESVQLRFSARVAPEVMDHIWHPSQQSTVYSDGHVEVMFQVEGIEELLRWVLGFGDQVEVLAPARVRERLRDVAAEIAVRHTPPPGPS